MLIYGWVHQLPLSFIMTSTGIQHRQTIADWTNFCRDVCRDTVVRSRIMVIGGPGVIVEIDESKFGKRKYNRGRRVEGKWVVGGIESKGHGDGMFFVTVNRRNRKTLHKVIKEHVRPGTIIRTDMWRGYLGLEDIPGKNYRHETVNHSEAFVTAAGVHTQRIESMWRVLKRLALPRTGARPHFYFSYFMEYMARRHFFSGKYAFKQFLYMINESKEYGFTADAPDYDVPDDDDSGDDSDDAPWFAEFEPVHPAALAINGQPFFPNDVA